MTPSPIPTIGLLMPFDAVWFLELAGAEDGDTGGSITRGGMTVVGIMLAGGVPRVLQVQAQRRRSQVRAAGWGVEVLGHPQNMAIGNRDGKHGRVGSRNGTLRN